MMNEFKHTIDNVNSLQNTENGAIGYSTTGQNLVDLNFTVPSNHNNVYGDTIDKFTQSLNDDLVTTVKWLFYLRDIREGLGERDSFISLFITLYNNNPYAALMVLPLIPEYGRWKDVVDILSRSTDETDLAREIYLIIGKQFKEDCLNMSEGKSVSLLAKWMPSINASRKSRTVAIRICRELGLYPAQYRKVLSTLRNYIDVTEVKTCGNKWNEIDYNKVSSNANSRYLDAFMKHDPKRRQKYLEELAKPTPAGAVMHASNLYPYEVYAKYNAMGRVNYGKLVPNEGVEQLWKNLKDIPTTGNTMVVVDGSGSMETHINGSSVMAIDVSRSLGIFFSERSEGEFKNKVIEFSKNPSFIDLSECKTLAEKYTKIRRYDDCSNTDIEKVFDLLLVTAVRNKLSQDELPQRILIVSDMEFDYATTLRSCGSHDDLMSNYKTLFDTINDKWNQAGYKMPELIFWNVNSRTNTIPVKENGAGVKLVSGFSVNNVKMILSGNLDPFLALKEVLDSPRYSSIEEILKNRAN